MTKIEFNNMRFHCGLNLTVRNGDKWAGTLPGTVLDIHETGNPDTATTATVMYAVLRRFNTLTDADLEHEHDPACRTVAGLRDALNRAYGVCQWGPTVTLLFFKPNSKSPNGWIGVDLDGTLAEYNGWNGPESIGAPVPAMADRVRQWLADGRDVRIFTARVSHDETGDRVVDALRARRAISDWCAEHLGRVLTVTNVKDYDMTELWDDRAVQVVKNTGARADGK